ncbi:MAG: hypothetical protein WAL20_01595 [Rhodomicrobium sp.]
MTIPPLYLDVDSPACPFRNASRKLEFAANAFADLQPLEGWLLDHGISHVNPNFVVAHPRGGLNMQAIHNSHDPRNGSDPFQRHLLGRNTRDFPIENNGAIALEQKGL